MTTHTDAASRYLATVPAFVREAIPGAAEAQAAYDAAVQAVTDHARAATAAQARLADVSYVRGDRVQADLLGTPKPGHTVEDVAAASGEIRRLRAFDHKLDQAVDDAVLALAEVVSADPGRNRAIAEQALAAAEKALEKVAAQMQTKGEAQTFLAAMDAAADRSNLLAPRAVVETPQARARRVARETALAAAGVKTIIVDGVAKAVRA